MYFGPENTDDKTMKTILSLIIFYTFICQYASAMEIIDIKRNIPLSEDEPVYKDYYIKTNGNTELKKNLVVKAVRKIDVKDSTLKAVGDFKTTVGLLKIIQVSNSVAVGREFKLIPRDEEPMLEQVGVMVGDEIDLAESFTDTSKPDKKRKPAEASTAEAAATPVTTEAPTPNIQHEVPTNKLMAIPTVNDI